MHYIAAWKYVSLDSIRAMVQREGEKAHVNQPKDEKSIHMYRHRHRVPSVLAWNVLVITRKGREVVSCKKTYRRLCHNVRRDGGRPYVKQHLSGLARDTTAAYNAAQEKRYTWTSG